ARAVLGHVLAVPGGLLDLAFGLGKRLSHLQRDQLREPELVAAQLPCGGAQYIRATCRAHLLPGRRGLVRSAKRRFDLRGACIRPPGQGLPGCWIDGEGNIVVGRHLAEPWRTRTECEPTSTGERARKKLRYGSIPRRPTSVM